MAIDPRNLPNDTIQLKQLVGELVARLDKSEAAHARTQELLRQLLADKRARQSEKLSGDQLALFAAAWPVHGPEPEPAPAETGDGDRDDGGDPPANGEAASATPSSKKARGGRKPLPKHLPRERRVHDVAGMDQPCAECGSAHHALPPDTSEHYEFIPAQLKVIEEVCLKYACACQIHTATKPAQPLPKSIASASLLAYVITAKYLCHLPLHRQEQMWAAQGIEVSRKTAGGWVGQVAALMRPLYLELKDYVFESKVLGHDDTGVKVLDPALHFARTGRLWPHCGDGEHPGVVFHYTPTRGGEEMKTFLAGYRGEYLQVDAYRAYDGLFTNPERKLREVGCWAHARRYVFKALNADLPRMSLPMLLIHELYQVEERARTLTAAGRLALRQEWSRPILQKLRTYFDRIRDEVLPKSVAARAIRYISNQWEALNRYCEDGDLSIDNNATERSLRGVAVGRRNWTFFGSDAGGETAAVLLSFVGSCRLAKVDAFAWFRDVLTRMAEGHPVNRLRELLPHVWQPAPTA